MEKRKRKRGSAGLVILILVLLAALAAGGYYIWQTMDQVRTTPPTITLKGSPNMTLYYGKKYKEPGYAAEDAQHRNLTSSVTSEVPEMKNTGTYTIRYEVKDSQGNSATAERRITVTFPPQTEEGAERGLCVLMYHDVYDASAPPLDVDTNKVSTAELEEQLKFLTSEGYYFPSWKEVRQYLDGKIDLPEKSIVLTFDDGDKGFQEYGVPLIEKYDVRATSFVIGSKNGDEIVKKARSWNHIILGSHSYDMHKPGGMVGHGGIMTALSVDDMTADLETSREQLGGAEAFAYPFGDTTPDCETAAEQAGFLVAFTTVYGSIHPGDDPYLLKRIRINGGTSLEEYKSEIGAV